LQSQAPSITKQYGFAVAIFARFLSLLYSSFNFCISKFVRGAAHLVSLQFLAKHTLFEKHVSAMSAIKLTINASSDVDGMGI